MSPEPRRVVRLVGVYNAKGTLLGEARYLWGRWRTATHCELCDISHGRVRVKPAFTALRDRLTVPFDLVHLDERTPEVAAASHGRAPCVLADLGRELVVVMDADALRACDGDVGSFEASLGAALRRSGLRTAP